jgi:alkanesulfonate monooxygenase SsuD/methylene tetrahydromethanopterin reductase-like flavin-dependent oxidoreductase (luciferase family)
MLSLSVVVADSDDEARLLFSSALQATTAPLPPPIADYETKVDPQRLAVIRNSLRHSLVGSPETVAKGLSDFIARYRPDEIITTAQIFDHAAHSKSLELLARAAGLVTSPLAASASPTAAAD